MKKVISLFSLIILSILLTACTPTNSTSTSETQPPQTTPASQSTGSASPQTNTSRYVPYTAATFEANKDKKRVLFFHASWCPTCQAAEKEINANLSGIPQDVILIKTDYDTEKELKKKYNITYQHTFVLVDENGNEIKKWNGGALKELTTNTK